jgi:hypothetical protein
MLFFTGSVWELYGQRLYIIVYFITSVNVLFIFVHNINLGNNLLFCNLMLNKFNVMFKI